jgi:hypothetical protein
MHQTISTQSRSIDDVAISQLQLLQSTVRRLSQYQRLQQQVKRIHWARVNGNQRAIPAGKTSACAFKP